LRHINLIGFVLVIAITSVVFVFVEEKYSTSKDISEPISSSQSKAVLSKPVDQSSGLDFSVFTARMPTYEKPSNERYISNHLAFANQIKNSNDLLVVYKEYARSDQNSDRLKAAAVLKACHYTDSKESLFGWSKELHYTLNDIQLKALNYLLNSCEGFAGLSKQERNNLRIAAVQSEILEAKKLERALNSLEQESLIDLRMAKFAEIEAAFSATSPEVIKLLSTQLIQMQLGLSTTDEETKNVMALALEDATCEISFDCDASSRFMNQLCLLDRQSCGKSLVDWRVIATGWQLTQISSYTQWRLRYAEALRTQDWKFLFGLN
jgi:hypothetical protein